MMLSIRRMTANDIGFAMGLKDQAGWNQVEGDWSRFLALEPDGCFVAEVDDQPCGTVTALTYGDEVGWAAMLLVDRRFRRRGIGTALLNHCLQYLQRKGLKAIKLDATDLGKPVYRRLDFVSEFQIIRMHGPRLAGRFPDVRQMRMVHMDEVAKYDRDRFGACRERLLRTYLQDERVGAGLIQGREGGVRGYCLARPGTTRWQVGPIVAEDLALCTQLLFFAMSSVPSPTVYVDVVASQTELGAFLEDHGFLKERAFTRMTLGSEPVHAKLENYFLIAGPEFG